jgi:hypothetical protein
MSSDILWWGVIALDVVLWLWIIAYWAWRVYLGPYTTKTVIGEHFPFYATWERGATGPKLCTVWFRTTVAPDFKGRGIRIRVYTRALHVGTRRAAAPFSRVVADTEIVRQWERDFEVGLDEDEANAG